MAYKEVKLTSAQAKELSNNWNAGVDTSKKPATKKAQAKSTKKK